MSATSIAATATCTLNFILTGQIRSGTSIVQGAINNANGAVCHANLLHPDASLRRACHEDYFGAEPDGAVAWFEPIVTGCSAPHYLSHSVFDQPRCGERAIGVRLPYPQLRDLDLYDYLRERYRDGDFCLVHVTRNPIACFVSLKQAERWRRWQVLCNAPAPPLPPLPVRVDVDELLAFVREHEMVAGKIQNSCRDYLELRYGDLYRNYVGSMRKLRDFLELMWPEIPSPRSQRPQPPRFFGMRATNWPELTRVSALRPYLDELRCGVS